MSFQCRAVLTIAIVLTISPSCTTRTGQESGSEDGAGSNHPLIVRFFDGCQRGDTELMEEVLAIETISQLDRLFAGDGGSRRSRLRRVASILAHVPVPQCQAGVKTERGYQLTCTNLGRDLSFEVVAKDEQEQLFLPDVPEELFARLENAPSDP